MFLKADLLFLELKICCLNCHHYATLFVLLQQFKLLGCLLLTRGPAGEAGQERGQRFTVLQGCLGPNFSNLNTWTRVFLDNSRDGPAAEVA